LGHAVSACVFRIAARFQHLKTQRNAFSAIRKISICSKRIALRFQGLKTRRIAVDALLKRRVATSLKIGLFNQKIMLSALRIVF
jgi:hypothetical protein